MVPALLGKSWNSLVVGLLLTETNWQWISKINVRSIRGKLLTEQFLFNLWWPFRDGLYCHALYTLCLYSYLNIAAIRYDKVLENGARRSWKVKSMKSNLFAINSLHNITNHEFVLRLAGQTGDNFELMSTHDLCLPMFRIF